MTKHEQLLYKLYEARKIRDFCKKEADDLYRKEYVVTEHIAKLYGIYHQFADKAGLALRDVMREGKRIYIRENKNEKRKGTDKK